MRAQGFLGAIEQRQQAGLFQLALMQATIPAHAVEEHVHDDAHWVIAWDGDYRTRAASVSASGPLTLVLNPPDTEHRDCFGSKLGRFMTISWSRSDWHATAEVLPLPRQPVQVPAANHLATQLANLLARSAPRLALESAALQLLDRAARESRDTAGMSWLQRAEDFLAAHPDCPDVRTLAKAVNLHPVSLARILRQHTGEKPAAFLSRHRLERACLWLRLSKRPLLEIALELGFADAAHFSHAFRRAHGVSPRSYRQRYRTVA